MEKLFFSSVIILLLSSCITSHSGTVSSGPLLSINDKYIDIASGTSQSVFVFGIGDLEKQTLVRNAKINLYCTRPLRKGEYYANFTTDIDKKLIFFVAQRIKVTVSADILNKGDSTSYVFGAMFSKKITPFKPVKSGSTGNSDFNGKMISNGDSVYYSYNSKNYNLYTVSSLDKETTVLLSTDPSFKSILVALEKNYFFIKRDNGSENKINEKVIIEVPDSFTGKVIDEEGLVLGYANNNSLVKTKSGCYIVQLSKLKR